MNTTEEKKTAKIDSKNNNDSIEIEQNNKLIINIKKAYDALQETCKEVGTVECGGYISGTMQLYVNSLMACMKSDGIEVPDFDLSGKNINNNDFLGFVDKLKDYAKKAMEDKNNVNVAPDNFLDFCDLLKEKLIRNGCS